VFRALGGIGASAPALGTSGMAPQAQAQLVTSVSGESEFTWRSAVSACFSVPVSSAAAHPRHPWILLLTHARELTHELTHTHTSTHILDLTVSSGLTRENELLKSRNAELQAHLAGLQVRGG
jgi:hypothetical protein